MYQPEEPPGPEELSFGEDPDREPRFRAWASAHRVLLAVGAVAVVLLGVVAGGGWYLYDRSREPLPPPDVAVPEQLRFAVGVCGEGISRCQTDQGRVIADQPRVEAALRAIPEVVSLEFVSSAASYNRWRGLPDRYPDVTSDFTLTQANFPDSFIGTLRHQSDYLAVAAKVRRIRGVRVVTRVTTDFWDGRADVTVTLCGYGPARACKSIGGRPVTDAQKRAILDRLLAVDGVEKIYFEDRAHALKLERLYRPEGINDGPPLLLELMLESYRVRTGTPKAAEAVRKAVRDMPGVQSVR
ncbi:permease-like cell division protein FtsX [Sphaerisporangium corydalis]|uniref:Permease-like cell division protein FtsX n=1 Tax=Sphaerisporangium corydalis TaxID=1441875 RepID=A0ABV9EB95_9ACTN|nr:permease-like cell division protein FtsX [Sphaerisporangium corydalis]